MNTPPSDVYSFNVRRLEWEWRDDPKLARSLVGIFKLRLNKTVPVLFVPTFPHQVLEQLDVRVPDWCRNPPPKRRRDVARLWAVLREHYIVTPDEAASGTIRRFELKEREAPLLLFFVGKQEFSAMQKEMIALTAQRSSVRSYWLDHEVRDHLFSRVIRERIAFKENLLPRHWKSLDRGC